MSTQNNGTPEFVPVVIIGAGPAGIAAATLLGQYGVECLVLDRHETVYPLPRAVHADDEVHRIIARLGIGDEFAANSRPALGLRLIDPKMQVLTEIPRSTELSAAHGFPQMNMFDQPELEAMLRANVKRYPQVTIRGNVEVTSVTQSQPDRVRVSFLDRLRGGEQSVQASYVLGCDGANSLTRAAIGAHMYGLPFTQNWLVIDVNTDADLNRWEGCDQLCNPERAGTYMRVGETRYRWEFQLLDGETTANYKTIADIEPLVRPWLGDIPADALELVRVTSYTFRAQVASRWRDRNVFILGDAAHLTPPFVGQGMAAGLRDALNLTWKLVGVLDKTLPESVLDTYEEERKLHAAAMILMAVSVGAAMTGGGRLGDLVRHVVFPRMQNMRLPGTRTSAAEGVTPGLRRSALVIKSRTPGGLAGTLCPNPVLGDGLRFDEVVGNGFALITSSPLTSAQRNALRSRGAAVVDAASGSELEGWLRKGRATAAIVRPDRVVMQAGTKHCGDLRRHAVVLRSSQRPRRKRKLTPMTELLVLNAGKHELQAVSLDGTRVRTLLAGLDELPDGIVVDQRRGHVYWTNMGAPDPGSEHTGDAAFTPNGSLERADLDGANRVTIAPRGAFTAGKQLTADFDQGVLYWCDREGMQVLRCNLDGSELRPLVISAVGEEAAHIDRNHCVGIAVDLDRRLLYWTQKGAPNAGEGRIFRAPLDLPLGTSAQHRDDVELLFKDLPEPIDLHLLGGGATLVWTDRGDEPEGNTLNRAIVQPTVGTPQILSTGYREAIGVAAVSESEFYVGDLGGSIRHINLDGGVDTELVHLGYGLTGIALAEL